MKNLYQIILSLLVGLVVHSFSSAQWQSVGPFGGYMQAFANDSSGNLYAAGSFGGVFKSTDNGDLWAQTYNDTLVVDVLSIAVNSSGTIFAGLGPGFMRSTDNGASWQKISNSLNTRLVYAVMIRSNGEIIAGTNGNGVYRSTDNGNSFSEINTGLTSPYITSLAQNGSGHLFAGTSTAGAFRSTDGGNNWTAINNGLNQTQIEWIGPSPFGYFYACAGNSIFRSTDNGDSWSNLSPPVSSYKELAFTPSSIYVATHGTGGVYTSADSGTTWTQVPGLPIIPFNKILSSGNMIFAGCLGLGVYRTTANSGIQGAWTQVVNGMTNTFVSAIAEAPTGEVYAATRHAGLFLSTDAGLTWSNTGLYYKFLNAVTVCPNGTVIAGGSSGRYRSTDQGTTWTEIGSFMQTNVLACNDQGDIFADLLSNIQRSTDDGVTWTYVDLFPVQQILDIAIDEDTIYLAVGAGSSFGASYGVYRSTNNGTTWGAFNNGLTNLNVTCIAVAETSSVSSRRSMKAQGVPGQCPRVIAGTQGAGIEHVSGDTWTITNLSASVMKAFVKGDKDVDLAITLDLLYSKNPSCNWVPAKPPLPRGSELSAIARRSGSTLVGTFGHGVQRGTVGPTEVMETQDLPRQFLLNQNYPNPFNPFTVIGYSLPERGHVSLSVFNVLGEEVAVLLDEEKQVGNYEADFNASKYSSGVYFYRLTAGKYTDTKKLLLLK